MPETLNVSVPEAVPFALLPTTLYIPWVLVMVIVCPTVRFT